MRRPPLAFETNKGQFAPGVLFGFSDKAVQVRITGDAIRFYRSGGTNKPDLEMTWRSPLISRVRRVEGEVLLPGYSELPDPRASQTARRWKTGIRPLIGAFGSVVSRQEISQFYMAVRHGRIRPCARTRRRCQIHRAEFQRRAAFEARRCGSLLAECEGLTVVQRRPDIYQELAGRKVPVSAII